jgi:hypothetical protein
MGAPVGNSNAVKGKIFRDAIRWALAHYEDEDPCAKFIEGPEKALRKMCLAQVKKAAEEGDLSSFRELADRVDGKPSQELSGPDGGAIPVKFVIEG